MDTLAGRLFALKQIQTTIQDGSWRKSKLFSNLQLEDVDNLNFIIDLIERKKRGIITGYD